jgi:hypothetical protein
MSSKDIFVENFKELLFKKLEEKKEEIKENNEKMQVKLATEKGYIDSMEIRIFHKFYNVTIDDISVRLRFLLEWRNWRGEEQIKFLIRLDDALIEDENGNDADLYFKDKEDDAKSCGKNIFFEYTEETDKMMEKFEYYLIQLFDFLEKLKASKYNKLEGCFILNEISYRENLEKIDSCILSIFDDEIDKCPVCLDCVGICQKAKCGHFICKKCCHTLLRKGIKKCPCCRKNTLQYSFNIEEDDEEEEDE